MEWALRTRNPPQATGSVLRSGIKPGTVCCWCGVEGHALVPGHGPCSGLRGAIPWTVSRYQARPPTTSLIRCGKQCSPTPVGAGMSNTRRKDKTRAWPSGQAPAFQAEHAGSIPAARSMREVHMSRTRRQKRPQMRLGPALASHQYRDGTVRDGTPTHADATCRHHGGCKYCERNRTFSTRRRLAQPE